MHQVDPNNPIPPLSAIQEAARYIREKQERDTTAQILKLKAALLPFAELLQDHNNFDEKGRAYPDSKPIFGINAQTITLGDLRRAYAAVVG